MASVGAACLIVALLTAAYSGVAALYGARTGRRQFVVSARRAMYAMAGVLLLAMALLEIAFARSDFSFSLVQHYSSTDTPLFYNLPRCGPLRRAGCSCGPPCCRSIRASCCSRRATATAR